VPAQPENHSLCAHLYFEIKHFAFEAALTRTILKASTSTNLRTALRVFQPHCGNQLQQHLEHNHQS
jgi:hypothetical protein